MSVAQYMEVDIPVLSSSVRSVQRYTKKFFPCLICRSWGVWWRQPVSSAICHPTCEHHTLLPLHMPAWISQCQQDSYTLPYMGTCGTFNSMCTIQLHGGGTAGRGQTKHRLEALGSNANLLLTLETGSESLGTEPWSGVEHTEQILSWIQVTWWQGRRQPSISVLQPFWYLIFHPLQVLQGWCGEYSSSWASGRDAQEKRLKDLTSLAYLHAGCIYHQFCKGRREQTQALLGVFSVYHMPCLLRRRLLTWSMSKDMPVVFLASWAPRRERGQATLGL